MDRPTRTQLSCSVTHEHAQRGPGPSTPPTIRGTAHTVYVGYISTALTGSQRNWIVTALAFGLVGYAGWMFIGSWRDRRAKGPARRVVGREPERSPEAEPDPGSRAQDRPLPR